LIYACIINNCEFDQFALPLWIHATIRLCADGGINHIYDEFDETIKKQYPPHACIGDLDSARTEVLQYYRNLVTTFITKQNHTLLYMLLFFCQLLSCIIWYYIRKYYIIL
jgi:thiamine pyrophosphokinase